MQDDSYEPQTVANENKKRKFRKTRNSNLIDIFEVKRNEADVKYAVCKLCEEYRAIKMTDSNTSGLHRHLKRYHKQTYDGVKGQDNPKVKNKNVY